MNANAEGVPTGPRGYILCQHESCGKEVSDVSKDAPLAYAKCAQHRRAYVPIDKPTKTEGDGNMSSKTKYRDPATKAKGVLTNSPQSRDKIAAKLKDAGYADATVQAQIYNLSHWKGCIVTDDGYAKNPDFVEAEKPVKAKKEKAPKAKKEKKAKAAKPKKAKSFHPVPKPSQAA